MRFIGILLISKVFSFSPSYSKNLLVSPINNDPSDYENFDPLNPEDFGFPLLSLVLSLNTAN